MALIPGIEQRQPAADDADVPSGPALLVVDDSVMYREGLAAILAGEWGASAVRTAADLASMTMAIDRQAPKVILLNLASADSRALLVAAREASPASRVVVIGVREDDVDEIIACADLGVAGYHLRSEPVERLLKLIVAVDAGESLCSPRVTAIIMARLSTLAARSGPDDQGGGSDTAGGPNPFAGRSRPFEQGDRRSVAHRGSHGEAPRAQCAHQVRRTASRRGRSDPASPRRIPGSRCAVNEELDTRPSQDGSRDPFTTRHAPAMLEAWLSGWL